MKRRDVKGKGEKQRYAHLNAEFQRIARRDMKAFLSDQCKETEENNRMGKTAADAEAPILWPPDVKGQLIGKDPDAGKD